MTCTRFAIVLLLAVFTSTTFAQQQGSDQNSEQATTMIAAQTASPKNYALLQPIATKPVVDANGLLQPMQEVAAQTVPADEGGIVITPHAFDHDEFDQHQLKVVNESTKQLRNAKILLKAPNGSVIQQVFPKPDSVDGLSVILTVDQLAPGEHQVVKLSIENSKNEFARVESLVLAENWDAEPVTNIVPEIVQANPSGITLASSPTTSMPPASGMLVPSVSAMPVSTTRVLGVADHATAETKTEEPEVVTTPVVVPGTGKAPATARLEMKLRGPADVVIGKEVEYSIDVANLTPGVAENMIVQLSIPANMRVTILDRPAWYDSNGRKVSWELDQLAGNTVETIRYKAILKKACSIEQSVVLGMDDSVAGTSQLSTTAR